MEWISVKDRLPGENDRVLAAIIYKGVKIVDVLRGLMIIDKVFCVTHWMPLPPFPHEIDDSVFLMTNKED